MSKASKRFSLSQLVAATKEAALEAVGVMLDELLAAVNSVSVTPIADAQQAGQLDAVWLVAQFEVANTEKTFAHNLGRAPTGFIEAKTFADPGETQVDGEVRMVSVTATTVVLRCAGASKKARLLLF